MKLQDYTKEELIWIIETAQKNGGKLPIALAMDRMDFRKRKNEKEKVK